jgi:hypothetical protein
MAAADRQDLGGKVVVRLEGAFDSYPQNQHLLSNAVIFLARRLVWAALILAIGMIVAAAILGGGH